MKDVLVKKNKTQSRGDSRQNSFEIMNQIQGCSKKGFNSNLSAFASLR
jgi:hypothetical protein